MTIEAWLTVAVIGLVIVALMSNRIGADVAMLGGLTLLLFLDAVVPAIAIMEPIEALSGFADRSVLVIAGLFVIAAGLQETGAMEMVANRVLGRPKSLVGAQLRLMTPVTLMSAFMNNTPIVAMYLPIVGDWAKKLNISPSRLYMPLSYAAIFGGACTLIGTSSNIAVNALWVEYATSADGAGFLAVHGVEPPSQAKQFWWIAVIGVPGAFVGTAFTVLASRWLLAERVPATVSTLAERRYKVEMEIQPGSPIVGKTIEQAGLRHLPGLYLTEIERQGECIVAVGPDERLEAGDRLVFVGIVESVVDLRKIRGLVPATDQVGKVRGGRKQRTLVEAVVAYSSPLVGKTVRESKFRTTYNAAIIAVHRDGELVKKKIGDIRLKPGDTLLLETHTGFLRAFRNSRDFHLVSKVEGAVSPRHERAHLAIANMALLVVLLVSGAVDQLVATFFCAGLMILTRCCTGTMARASINLQVLIVIAAAIGLGRALDATGAADAMAYGVVNVCRDRLGMGPHGFLFVVFAMTSVFSQFITNKGGAVLMFPITIGIAEFLGVSPEPFVLAVMAAAAYSCMTPVACQTNLMVYGPGGYRFADYMRIGVPLTLLLGVLTTVVAPLAFDF